MKKTAKKQSVFWSLVMTGLVPVLCSLFILCSVMLFVILRSADSVDRAKEEMVTYRVSTTFDDMLSSVSTGIENIQNSGWFHSCYVDYLNHIEPITQTAEIARDLYRIVSSDQQLIAHVAFRYAEDEDHLYTEKGMLNSINFLQKQYPERLDYAYYPDADPGFSIVSAEGNSYILYSRNLPVVRGGKEKVCVNFLIRLDKLEQFLKEEAGGYASSFSILDRNGTMIWSTELEPLSREAQVQIDTEAAGFPIIYRLTVPVSSNRKTVREAVPVLLVTLFADLCACILLVVYYSKKNSRPLQEIVSRYKDGNDTEGNEIEILNSIMTKAFTDKKEAEKLLQEIYPIARQRMLHELLDGTAFSECQESGMITRFTLQFPYPFYNVLDIRTNIAELIENNTAEELEFQVVSVAMEDYVRRAGEGLSIKAELYLHTADHCAVIVNCKDEIQLKMYLERLFELCTLVGEKNALVQIGVGRAQNRIDDIHAAADQAHFALNYSRYGTMSGIRFYEDVAKEARILFSYPESERMLLSRAISDSNRNYAARIIEEITDSNASVTFPYSMEMLYSSMCATMITTAQEHAVFVQLEKEPKPLDSMNEVRERAVNLAYMLCDKMKEKKGVTDTRGDRRLIQYVDEHIYDPELSLTTLAEVFDRSSTTISEAFKRITGEKYIDYVNKKRIQKAVELICCEKMDMNKVYQKVGYVSISTFRRNYQRFSEHKNTQESHTDMT